MLSLRGTCWMKRQQWWRDDVCWRTPWPPLIAGSVERTKSLCECVFNLKHPTLHNQISNSIIGPAGSATQFIKDATHQHGKTIGHGLEWCGTQIWTVRVNHPTKGYLVTLVDILSSNDTSKSDDLDLTMITEMCVCFIKCLE